MITTKDIVFLVTLLIASPALTQSDSAKELSFNDYFTIVKENHPVAKQAFLQAQMGDAKVLEAKGSFDPVIGTDVNQKYFSGSKYYSILNAGLKIPTWFGIEVYSGFDQNQGVYLNPEHTLPNSGLLYAGISVPLGQDLFIDKRMLELGQAKIFQQSSIAQQKIMINNLLYESGKIYWNWFVAYNKMIVFIEAFETAKQRADGVKMAALQGDRPFIDTVEAGIQVQNRKLNLQQAQLEYQNARALLSVYLWFDGAVPLELEETTTPPTWAKTGHVTFNPELVLQIDTLISSHPELQIYEYKSDYLGYQKRYLQEQLKPELNLKYNAITEPINGDPFSTYSINNYTWGLEFSSSLFLREERGALQMTSIEIQELNYEINLKKETLFYKASYASNEWRFTEQQVILFNQTVQDYNQLLNAEKTMFEIGESSLFMINSREMDFIQAQLKLIELISKNQTAYIGTLHALGTLN
jgi:outer membrane protein TolC